jgi:hypothetical protein
MLFQAILLERFGSEGLVFLTKGVLATVHYLFKHLQVFA